MAGTKAISIEDLQREAKRYENTLQTLPFSTMEEATNTLGINLIEVANKNTIVAFERNGRIARPYSPGDEDFEHEIGKVKERTLQVEKCYAAIKDHIDNYKEMLVATNNPLGEKVNNKTKEHPLAQMILNNMVTTVSEDIVDAMFFSQRDVNDKSPLGMFDGFFPLIDLEVASGDIAVGKGNLKTTGALVAPTSDTDTEAYEKLVEFIRTSHVQLQKNGVVLISKSALFNVMDALRNQITNKPLMAYDVFLEHLRGTCSAPKLQLRTHEALGTGSKLIYTLPGNLDLGMNTITDKEFIQVRQIYNDPNYVQFWNQFEMGARIRNIHQKMFRTNEQSNTGLTLSGDYIS